jgi:hypothetical protein
MSKHDDHVGAVEHAGPHFHKPVKVQRIVYACGMHPLHQHATSGEAEECISKMNPEGEPRPQVLQLQREVFE